MMPPALSVRADLYRAALHFAAGGEEARARPELAGVRIERSGAGGAILVAMCSAGLITIRDPEGWVEADATFLIPRSFFDAARRAQREHGMAHAPTTLDVERGEARLNPGPQAQSVAVSRLPYPDWRRAIPNRSASSRLHPAISPEALERLDHATTILAGLAETLTGVVFTAAEDKPDIIADFEAWPLGFAVLRPAVENTRSLPWRAPLWILGDSARAEARAS